MIGALLGDISGSRYEWDNIRTKTFPLLDSTCYPTDDSIMTLAIAQALIRCQKSGRDLSQETVEEMQRWVNLYPDAGYGGYFSKWLRTENPRPYNSFGNGAAMRVSPCGWAGTSLKEVTQLARTVTQVSHNHPEALKGAEAVACAIYLARNGSSKEEIWAYTENHYYPLDFRLEDIRENYRFDVSCQGSVPPAIAAFLEARDFSDAIRNAISIGGDSDTIAAICGSIAEAFYGIPMQLRREALTYLEDPELLDILQRFEEKYPPKIL